MKIGVGQMSDATNQFKKTPRKKAPRGRSVVMSPEAKQAYADLMNERAAKELSYGQHLPPDMKR